jgi:hypothetical protein
VNEKLTKNPKKVQKTLQKFTQSGPRHAEHRATQNALLPRQDAKSLMLEALHRSNGSCICTDRHTDRQTYIVVTFGLNTQLSYAREETA